MTGNLPLRTPIIKWSTAETNGDGAGEKHSLLHSNKANGWTSSFNTQREEQRAPISDHSTTRHHRRCVPLTLEYRRQRYEHRKQLFACSLAAVSGFADVLCHHSFGCYGNMMTGNTIRLLDNLTSGDWANALYPVSLVPSYIVGAALCNWLNFLDLTVLGLGGPSQEEFAHLNPPRRLRSPQQISVLRVVAIVSVGFFLLGEFVSACFSGEQHKWRLPFFACAFGLINAATLNAVHLVTNAVTGHWITIGLGVADDLPVVLDRQSSAVTVVEDAGQAPKPKPKKWTSSLSVAGSFIGSITITSILYNECVRENEAGWGPLHWLSKFSPPMGVTFALVYTVLLYWYTLPPPFLHGFNSRVDLASLV